MTWDLEREKIDVVSFSLDREEALAIAEGEAWLSRDEKERSEKFRFGELRDRYIRGRGMLRFILSRYLRCDPADLEFGVGEHGKPYLLDDSLHFNLSHSIDIAVVAVSEIPSIGIDVERFDRDVDYDRLADRCFRPREWDRFRGLEGAAKAEAFFWIWTAKEARMKATGEGFRLEPKRIEIAFEGEYPRKCLEPISPRAYLSPARLPTREAACTVAALSPFEVRPIPLSQLQNGGDAGKS